MIEMMKKYLSAFSVSGSEESLAAQIAEDLKSCTDAVSYDAMGNLILFRKGKNSSKKLMLAAHMDEIGFVVTHIEENGLLRVSNIGGIRVLASAYHEVVLSNGTKGVLLADSSVKPADLDMKKLYVDIGAETKKQAAKKAAVGDFLTLTQHITRLTNNRYAAKALDDRIGCVVLAQAALSVQKPRYDTYYVFTVQEEIGCRGSKTAANAILPTWGIAVDVTPTNDVPGAQPGDVKLGQGAAIKIKDSSAVCSKLIIDRLTSLAEKSKIPYQYEVLTAGGTDTSSMQLSGSGAYAGCISIPTRNVHTPCETVDVNDLKACVALFRAVIEEGAED